jgi:hypothetical protein
MPFPTNKEARPYAQHHLRLASLIGTTVRRFDPNHGILILLKHINQPLLQRKRIGRTSTQMHRPHRQHTDNPPKA